MKTDSFESFCRVLESMVKCRIDIVGYLHSQGYVRLVEAGKGLRVYDFYSFAGERMKIAIGNDGFLSVVPLELPGKKGADQEK